MFEQVYISVTGIHDTQNYRNTNMKGVDYRNVLDNIENR